MIKKALILLSVVIILFISILLVINNKKAKNEENTIVYETVSDEEENKFDPVDYHYYVKLIKYDQQNVKKNATREEREKYYYYDNNIKEAVFEMCKKDGEWEYIVYTDNIGKYNKKDGLLGGFKFDNLKLIDDNEIAPYIYVEASNDKVKRLYHIYWDEIFNINVDLISEEDLKTNEITNYELKTFTKENTKQNFIDLCKEGMKYPSEYEWAGTYYGDNVAVTKNFRNKYPFFLDVFIHYSPLEYNNITLKDLDIDNQIAIFEVDSILECKSRTYDVKYLIDDNMYLDDVVIQLNNEKNIELDRILKNNYDGSQSFYYNTNWELYKKAINYTDVFFNKFKEFKSDFIDIESIDYNFKFEEPYYKEIRVFENEPGVVCSFLFKDKTLKYYYRKFIYNNKNQLDDVINEKLPYDSSMTIEEVRDAYIRDYVEKK